MRSQERGSGLIMLLIGSTMLLLIASRMRASRRLHSQASLKIINDFAASHRKLRHHTSILNSTTHGQDRSLKGMDIQLERTTYKIPTVLDVNLVNWDDTPSDDVHHNDANKQHEVPIFWHILKSGGTTIKLMYATCYNFVEACETGGWIEAIGIEEENMKKLKDEEEMLKQQLDGSSVLASQQEEIQKSQEIIFTNLMQQQNTQTVVDDSESPLLLRRLQEQMQLPLNLPLRIVDAGDGRKYVNVDVTTLTGIQNAVDRGFVSNHLADVMFTPLLVDATAKLLNGDGNKGRLFSIFRHPIDRVVSVMSKWALSSLELKYLLCSPYSYIDKYVLLPPKGNMGTNI